MGANFFLQHVYKSDPQITFPQRTAGININSLIILVAITSSRYKRCKVDGEFVIKCN